MHQPTRLRCSGPHDLLTIASLLLEFQPDESVVSVCMRGDTVKFCARSDLGMDDDALDATAAQLLRGFENTRGREFILLGYGRDMLRVRDAMVALGARLGPVVTMMVATNHERFWRLEDGELPAHAGEPYAVENSGVAAHAVYRGVSLRRTRAEAVAAVQRPPAHLRAEISVRLEAAFERVLPMDPDDRIQLFGHLIDSGDVLASDDAAELAALLQVQDCQGEFLCQLSSATAARFHARLVEARAASDEECEADVLGPLALACWLAGKGAQMNECVAQLEEVAPRNPVLRLLRQLLHDAVPPSRWDSW
ncbi:DUF4192 family protein [Tessaracoccus rhinocerotis]|uniref:DUF4192 family protein n=1 Tax=Tessaracoccus rhinocerotis TaxID=1689449 RepID=A0A553K4C9_9ACTN|nr:DUF4192 family protein [Tessaracoccus rhinocerotis]TRY19558.1 DUF4192 family protein [Tessaracoccus rhinocerotis]